jgi:hypothetical protein
MIITAARTSQPPIDKCGMKRRTSMRNASKAARNVGRVIRKRPIRKRAECPGEWKWAARAIQKQTKASSAAIGCMMRMYETLWRVSSFTLKCSLVGLSWSIVYPTSMLEHRFPLSAQNPQTPNRDPSYSARERPLMTGVVREERSRRRKAMKKRKASGVAGRNMVLER